MIKDFENRVTRLLEEMKEHALVIVEEGPNIRAYYMKKPGTRIMSTLITFTPEGIVLQGDLTPEHHGSVSAIGYGRDWFAGQLSPSYLCEKFLDNKWSSELAVERLRDPESSWRDEEADPATISRLDELACEVECGQATQGDIYDVWLELDFETADGVPGWGYDPQEAVVLVTIQRKFAELWAKKGA